jgi:hypothetical protein
MVESDLRGRSEPPSLYRCPDSVVDYRNGETSTFSDGLSQTGLLAECYPSAAQQSVSGLYDDPVGAVFRTSRRFDMSSELDAYLVECDQIGQIVAKTRPPAFKQFGLGADWTNGSLGVTRLICMNPTQLTNCSNGPSYRAGLFAPSSNHEGRFHIGLADGAVRSLTNQVDKEVWRALGSKDGSEVINQIAVF